jgi:hypothetical protein
VGGMHTFVPHFCTNRFVFICWCNVLQDYNL